MAVKEREIVKIFFNCGFEGALAPSTGKVVKNNVGIADIG